MIFGVASLALILVGSAFAAMNRPAAQGARRRGHCRAWRGGERERQDYSDNLV